MIFLASLLIRAAILALLAVSWVAATEFYSVAFKGFRCTERREDGNLYSYVPANFFGKLPIWQFLVLSGSAIAMMACSVAGLAFLDFSING